MSPFKSCCSAALLLGLLLIASPGCTSDVPRQEVYKVSGKITMGSAAVADAVVTFSPKGKQPVAVGRTDSNGQYTLKTYDPGDGAAAGDYVVLVTKAAPGGGPEMGHDPNSPEKFTGPPMHKAEQAPKSELPEKYGRADQSDLKATVTADGQNEFNFDLKPES